MNYLSFGFLIFIPLFLYGQDDSSTTKKKLLSLDQNTNEEIDTSRKVKNPQSLLHLKVLLDSQLNNLKLNLPNKDSIEGEFLLYDFSKEELNSGLSKKELIAYKKNKDQFRQILQREYDKIWWARVKSVGQLLGNPNLDWVIKAIEFALLFAL